MIYFFWNPVFTNYSHLSVLQEQPTVQLYLWLRERFVTFWLFTHAQYPPKKAYVCFSLVYAGPAHHVMLLEPRSHAVFSISFSTERRGQRLLYDRTRHPVQEAGDPKNATEFFYSRIFSFPIFIIKYSLPSHKRPRLLSEFSQQLAWDFARFLLALHPPGRSSIENIRIIINL